MDIVVGKQFLRSSPDTRRRLIATIDTYVTHAAFISLIRQLNPDDAKGVETTRICLQLAQFNSNAALWDEVELWLGSQKRIYS